MGDAEDADDDVANSSQDQMVEQMVEVAEKGADARAEPALGFWARAKAACCGRSCSGRL